MHSSEPWAIRQPEADRVYRYQFWILLAVFEGLVFSLPVFPTGDSGLHLYYASVFRDLIFHRSPLYAQFYAVRHLVQPYLIHYYTFILLRVFLSDAMAEKVLIAGVLAFLAFGFRSLVRAFSPMASGLILLVFPFLLNWELGMGALNYLFGIALLFFALAEYERLLAAGEYTPRLWRFGALLFLLVLAHPVPLLLLACAIAVDAALFYCTTRPDASRSSHGRTRYLALLLTCVAFLIPILIADRSEVGRSVSDIHFHRESLSEVIHSQRLCMFFLTSLPGRLYSKIYLLLFPVSLGAVFASDFVHRLQERRLTAYDRLAIFSVLFFSAIAFAPREINGSSFFASRLYLPCWLLAIAACAGAVRGSAWNRAAAFLSAVLTLMTLGAAWQYLRPIALRSAAIVQAPLPVGKRGLLIQSNAGDENTLLHTNYPLYFWNAGRAFASHHDVLLNSAWLNLTIMPVKENGQSGLLRDYTPLRATENPNTLGNYLIEHPVEKARVLETADFVLFVDPIPEHPDPGGLAMATLGTQSSIWACTSTGYFAVCTKR